MLLQPMTDNTGSSTVQELLDCLEAKCNESPGYAKRILKLTNEQEHELRLLLTKWEKNNQQQQNQNQSFIEAPKVEKILEQKHSFPEQPAQDLKPNVHGVGIIFTPDSAEMKLEPLGEITNAVKVFDERLQTTCDDFHTMSYSKQNYNQFLVANEGHRTYQIKKVESIIEGAEQGGIDVELREVTQLPDRISPINIRNPKILFLTYDPGGATCLFDKQEKLLGYASSPVQFWKKVDSIEQPTTDIWNSVGSTVKSELQQVFGTAGMNIYRVQTILAKEKINEVVRNDTINGQVIKDGGKLFPTHAFIQSKLFDPGIFSSNIEMFIRSRFNVALDRIHVKLWSIGISFGLSDKDVTIVYYMVKEKRIAIRVLVESTTIQIPTFFAGSQGYGAIWTGNDYVYWEEMFRGNTDTRPYDPQFISFDVFFYKSIFMYGILEHASSFTHKLTRGPGVEEAEPYLLFNLDVGYVHNLPFGIYGSIMLVLSLWKSGKSYEIFWLKATKMQIDILANGWDAENEILMPLDARNLNDFSILLETCRLLRNCDQNSMNIIGFFAAIPTSLLDALPPIKPINRECFMGGQIDMIITDVGNLALDNELVQQIAHFDSSLLLQFTNVLLSKNSIVCWLHFEESDATEVSIIAIACAFLHVTFNRFYKKSVLLVWVYGTELVSILGNVIKRCHHNHKWLFLLELFSYLLGDAPVWLLPISIFCPLYKHKFRIVDNEEFYEQEKPSYLKNLRYLTFILRQASQQFLRMNSSVHHNFGNWVPTTLLALYLHLILEDKDSFEWEGIVMTRSSWAKDQH